jgi:hypothetical protein
MKRMRTLGYLHAILLLKVRYHIAKFQLLQANMIKVNKTAFGFREKNHIKIHHKFSITGGTYFTFNFVL